MTVWINADIKLTTPLTFQDKTKNLVICGKFTSDSDITLKVKNLVVFGQISTTKDISLNTTADFFNAGSINGRNISIVSEANVFNGIGNEAFEKIRALGINLIRTSSDDLIVRIPG